MAQQNKSTVYVRKPSGPRKQWAVRGKPEKGFEAYGPLTSDLFEQSGRKEDEVLRLKVKTLEEEKATLDREKRELRDALETAKGRNSEAQSIAQYQSELLNLYRTNATLTERLQKK